MRCAAIIVFKDEASFAQYRIGSDGKPDSIAGYFVLAASDSYLALDGSAKDAATRRERGETHRGGVGRGSPLARAAPNVVTYRRSPDGYRHPSRFPAVAAWPPCPAGAGHASPRSFPRTARDIPGNRHRPTATAQGFCPA